MTDEAKNPSDLIAENLDKILSMSPEEHEAFAKTEISFMLSSLMELSESERVDTLYALITDRLNRIYMFGYNNGYSDGHLRGRGILN